MDHHGLGVYVGREIRVYVYHNGEKIAIIRGNLCQQQEPTTSFYVEAGNAFMGYARLELDTDEDIIQIQEPIDDILPFLKVKLI